MPELTVTVALWDFGSWLFVAVGAVVVVLPLPPPELDWPAVVDVGTAVWFVLRPAVTVVVGTPLALPTVVAAAVVALVKVELFAKSR